MGSDQLVTWQPVMLVVTNRIECRCGAKAIFVVLNGAPIDVSEWEYTAWCQHCFEREQEEAFNG
jgi:hypothetical protein